MFGNIIKLKYQNKSIISDINIHKTYILITEAINHNIENPKLYLIGWRAILNGTKKKNLNFKNYLKIHSVSLSTQNAKKITFKKIKENVHLKS